MSGKDIFDAMGSVDERFIEEAERECPAVLAKTPLVKWLSLAACFCAVLLCTHLLGSRTELAPGALPPVVDPIYTVATPNHSSDFSYGYNDSTRYPNKGSSIAAPANSLTLCVFKETDYGYLASVMEECDEESLRVGDEVKVVLELDDEAIIQIPEFVDSYNLLLVALSYSYDESTNTLYVHKYGFFTVPDIDD